MVTKKQVSSLTVDDFLPVFAVGLFLPDTENFPSFWAAEIEQPNNFAS